MANNCWNWISLTGETANMELLEDRLNKYKQTKYFTEWGDYVLGIGAIGDTEEVFKKRHKHDPYYVYGTKWFEFEIDDINIDDKSGQCDFRITGDSAWSPPITLIVRICEKFNLTAEMEYEEGGMDFAGIISIDASGIKSHDEMTCHEYRYKDDVDSWVDNLAYNYEGEEDLNYTEIMDELKTDHDYASEKDLLRVITLLMEWNKKSAEINKE